MPLFVLCGNIVHPDKPVFEQGARMPIATLGNLVDCYRQRHAQLPDEPTCCPKACCGLEAVMDNAPRLLEAIAKQKAAEGKPPWANGDVEASIAAGHWQHTVPVPMVTKYVGEALALLTATGDHTGAWEDPADVRLARAVRVLTEFITLVAPPKEQSCGTGSH